MTVEIQKLSRVFRFGATELADTDPSMPPQDVLRAYVGAYPFLATATVGEPEIVGDRMVYPIIKREVQTKGAALRRLTKAQASALASLNAMANAEATSAPENAARWMPVAQLVGAVIKRPATPIADAMMVPML